MKKYVVRIPREFRDQTWFLKPRYLPSSGDARLDFRECRWIDLHPAAHLILQASEPGRRRLVFDFGPEWSGSPPFSFLASSGYFKAISRSVNAVIRLDSKELRPEELDLFLTDNPARPLVLEQRVVLPWQVLSAAELTSRSDVHDLCWSLWTDYVDQRTDLLGITQPLLYPTKNFFSAVLPELVDNVRVHKKNKSFCIFVRLRQRDPSGRIRRLAERVRSRTVLQKEAAAYWESDTVEVVFGDSGKSIQETLLASRTGRTAFGRQALAGPNAGAAVLERVFLENLSRLDEKARRAEGLPTLTGLRSVRNALGGLPVQVQVASGNNLVLVTDRSYTASRRRLKFRRSDESMPGVYFHARIAAEQDRPFHGASVDALEGTQLEDASSWWAARYHPGEDRCHLVEEPELPAGVGAGDVVICRFHHQPSKGRLFSFLKEVAALKAFCVFFGVPPSVGVPLRRTLDLELQLVDIRGKYPIVSNDFRLSVATKKGDAIRLARSFSGSHNPEPTREKVWWEKSEAPVRSVRDLFVIARLKDTRRFWNAVLKSPYPSFIQEPVKWSDGYVLRGGYLLLEQALDRVSLVTLLRKWVVLLANGLRAQRIVAGSSSLYSLMNEVDRHWVPEPGGVRRRTLVLGSVEVTGGSLAETVQAEGQDGFGVPIFRYPEHLIQRRSGAATGTIGPRLLDWSPMAKTMFGGRPTLSRLGRTDRVRRGDRRIQILAKKDAADSYRVWQNENLLRLGHLRHGDHHSFVTVDLVGFILSRSSEAQSFIRWLKKQVDGYRPDWVLVSQNRAAVELREQLRQSGPSEKSYRFWPLERISELLGIGELAADHRVVVLDDGLVTGETLRRAQQLLSDGGVEHVKALAVLTRMDPKLALGSASNERFRAWWSLVDGTTKRIDQCPLCRSLRRVRQLVLSLRAHQNEVASQLLEKWLEYWSAVGASGREQVRSEPMDRVRSVRLGTTIDLRTSIAEATWLLELGGRLGNTDRLLREVAGRRRRHGAELALAGTCLFALERLSFLQQERAVIVLTEFAWKQTTDLGLQSLLFLALVRCSETASQAVREAIERKLRSSGVSNAQVALGALAAIASSTPEKLNELHSWRKVVASQMEGGVNKRRSQDTMDSLLSSAGKEPGPHLVLRMLGAPNYSRDHTGLMDVLVRIIRADRYDRLRSDLEFLGILLGPLQSSLVSEAVLSQYSGEQVEKIERVIAAMDKFVSQALNGTLHTRELPAVKEASADLKAILFQAVIDGPSIRRVLLREHIVDLGQVLMRALSKCPSVDRAEFVIRGLEGRQLEIDDVDPSLGVVADRGLEMPICDCLSDVKHPRDRREGLDGSPEGPYMEVVVSRSASAVSIRFSNTGRREDEGSHHFRVVQRWLRQYDGVATEVFDIETGRLIRELSLPAVLEGNT